MKNIIKLLILPFIFIGNQAIAAGEYDAQIDALQNELLKMKQAMASDKSKAYFKKGKGLSIKSTDGKYSFQIKGRAMYDLSYITNSDRIDSVADTQSLGSEFRRLRFSIKVGVGDGWGFAFQPDFAETIADNSNTGGKGVDVKDAFISKKIKGIGSFKFGNAKTAGGMWENTSSNSLLWMERPMYNEVANLAHRMGVHYDTGGSLGKNLHLAAGLTWGDEGAWRQEQENAGAAAQDNDYNFSVATHYTAKLAKKNQVMIGGSFTHETFVGAGLVSRKFEARAQGVHTLGDKIIDSDLVDLDSYSYGGPQFAYTDGPLFVAGEYYWMRASRDDDAGALYGDAKFEGGTVFGHYFINGNANVKISSKKGKIGGVKCKAVYGCTALKLMYEKIDTTHSEATTALATAGHIAHFGVNHYFNSNVRLMFDGAKGFYRNGNPNAGIANNYPAEYTPFSLQTRLHIKF
tara:strand:+ start:12542 stop:13924 length:1383 start_codon:yes stop_codon:yes gene_type:complete